MISHRFYPRLMVTYVFFILTLIWSCGKGPTKVDVGGENDPPDTIITQKALSKIPIETDTTGALLNLNSFEYSMEFTGVDLDGKADSFRVKINDGPWSSYSTSTSSSGTLEFASGTATNTVFVQAKDDQGAEDPTPAAGEFSLVEFDANAEPTTRIDSGPSDGSTIGRYARFVLNGSDEDGQVVSFSYSFDGGEEKTITPGDEGTAVIEFSAAIGNLLSVGNHSISVRSLDNLGAEDSTPVTRSFLVQAGFSPIINQTSGPTPGGGWFADVSLTFAWSADVSQYTGAVDSSEYSIDDPANFQTADGTSVSVDPLAAGMHTFRLRVIDKEGNVSTLESNFEVVALSPTDGILLIDNVNINPSPTAYASEADVTQKILDGFFKNFSAVSVWDVDHLSGPDRFPGAINATRYPGAADLAKYSSVVIMANDEIQAGEDIAEVSPLFEAYFKAGGNVMLASARLGSFNAKSNLLSTLGARTLSPGNDYRTFAGFTSSSSRNSDAYSFINGDSLLFRVPDILQRTYERVRQTGSLGALRIFRSNQGLGCGDDPPAPTCPSDFRTGQSTAVEGQAETGNWALVMAISLEVIDQSRPGIVAFGDFLLGSERFAETKN